MNMKTLLKELVKDPQIKALYKEGFDRSFINKLIIESLMEAEEEEKQLKNRMREIAREFKKTHGKNWKAAMVSIGDGRAEEYKQIEAKLQQIRKAPKLAQKTPFKKKAQKEPIAKKDKLRKTIGLLAFKNLLADPKFNQLLSKLDDKRKEKIQKALADKVAQQLEPEANIEQAQAIINKTTSAPAIQQQIKQIATEPENKQQRPKRALFFDLLDEEERRVFTKIFMSIVDKIQEANEMTSSGVPTELYQKIYKFLSLEEKQVFIKALQNPEKKKAFLAAIQDKQINKSTGALSDENKVKEAFKKLIDNGEKPTPEEWKNTYMTAVKYSYEYLQKKGLDVKELEALYDSLVEEWKRSPKDAKNNFDLNKSLIMGKISGLGVLSEEGKEKIARSWWNMMKNAEESAKNELVPKKLIQNIASKVNAQGQQLKDLVTNLVANYGIPEKQEKAKEQMSTALVKAGVQEETALAIANNKQAVEDLGNALSTSFEPGRQSLKELYDAIQGGDDDMIKKAVLAAYKYSKSEIGANFDNVVEQVKKQAEGQSLDKIKSAYIEAYKEHKDSLQLFEEPEELQPTTVDNNESESASPEKVAFQSLIMLVIALYLFYSKIPTEEPTEEPGQPIPSSGTVSPKVYAELYDKILEDKFDTFEDNFLRTPFLSTQSEVLTELVDAVSQFNNKLSEAEKQSFSRKAEPELKEANEKKYPIVKFDPKDQKLIMSEHKMMEKYLKMLVKMVTNIDEEKINTVGFEQDSRKIRAIAKQLLESIVDLMKIIASAQQEERKGLEFKEAIIREDNKKPRTQLTRDQIIDFMEESYDLIVDYGTNIEKYSRTEKEAIELKPVQDTIVKLNQVFAEILPYFPAHSPFGKTASLKEIKKQVRGISRDIVQVMKQAKGLVERPDNFDEKAIENFSAVLLTTVDKLQKYFDLEIDDAEIKAMLPKVPPAKSASYGKDSEGIFNRIQDIIKQYSPKVQAQAKKIYKKYSSEVQKALKNGMTWAERHAKTLGDKAKPYLDKVKKAFKEVKLKVTNMLQKLGPDFGDLNLTKEDAEEVIKSMAPQFHSDVIKVEAEFEWEPEEDDEPEANILQDVIKKMKKDEYYSPSDSEGVELLKSFAKAVTNQDNKRGMANAIRNWFYGLESTDQFGTFKNLFFKESKDYETKLDEYWRWMGSSLLAAIRAYATLKYKEKSLKNRRKANKKAVEIIMHRIDEWFNFADRDKYPNQNKYEAFSSHSSEFLLDVDKEISKVKDELGKKPEEESDDWITQSDEEFASSYNFGRTTIKPQDDEIDLDHTAEQDPGKEFLEKYEDRYNAIKELMASDEGPKIKVATRAGRRKTYFQRWWTLQKKFEDILTKFDDNKEVEEEQIDIFVNRITHLENDLKKDGYLGEPEGDEVENKKDIKDKIKNKVDQELEGEDTSKLPSEEKLKQMATEIVDQMLDNETIENAEELNLEEKDLIQMAIEEFNSMYEKKDKIDEEDVRKLVNSEFGQAIDEELMNEFGKHKTYTEELHNFLRELFRIVNESYYNNNSKYTPSGDFESIMEPLQEYVSSKLNSSWSELIENLNEDTLEAELKFLYDRLYDYFSDFYLIKDVLTNNPEQTQKAVEDLKQTAEKLDDINKEKPTETDDSAAKKDDTYSEAKEKGFKPSNITRIICPSCSTKFNFAVPDKRLDKPRKRMKMRCEVCTEQFPFSPKKGNYLFKKEGEKDVLVKGRDIFEADGNLDALKQSNNDEEEFDSEEFTIPPMTFDQVVDQISELPSSPDKSKQTEKQSNNNDDDELGDLSWLGESRQSQIQRKIEKIIEHYLKTGKL